MSDAEKCPKCGGTMLSGSVPGSVRILKKGDLSGDNLNVLYCRECGFVELYKQASSKEPWRWWEPEEVPTDEPRPLKENLPSTEKRRKKLVR